jgi:hypothetical protein
MDMLNSLQKLVAGEPEEALETEIRRSLQVVYPTQECQTPAGLLLERLLAQAEATPQLAASHNVLEEPIVLAEEPVCQPNQGRVWWTRFLLMGFLRRATLRRIRDPQTITQSILAELHRERVEIHMRQVRSGSSMKPLL